MRRALGVGASAAVVYLVAAWLTFGSGVVPVRPFFDGVHVGPYLWVEPPPDAQNAAKPTPGEKEIFFGKNGNEQDFVSTGDGQAQVLLPEGAIAAKQGQKSVVVKIEPVDAKGVGDPPEGTSFNGNAYRVSAAYQPSGEPARFVAGDTCPEATARQPTTCVTVVLRYAYLLTGIELYRRSGPDWTPVVATDSPANYSMYGDTPEPGVFVVTGVGQAGAPEASRTTDFIAIGLGVLAVAIGVAVSRARKDRKRREMVARARGKKMKNPAGKPQRPG